VLRARFDVEYRAAHGGTCESASITPDCPFRRNRQTAAADCRGCAARCRRLSVPHCLRVVGVSSWLKHPTTLSLLADERGGTVRSVAADRKFPRIQLLTVGELLDGKRIEYPPSRQVDATFKKAPKAKGETATPQQLPL
jgi:hypothetical protein